jgi:hypothetical protein
VYPYRRPKIIGFEGAADAREREDKGMNRLHEVIQNVLAERSLVLAV